jgi:two-component system chemotaxis response regulator CheY
MKTLIVEDDATSRLFLVELLSGYGTVHAVDEGVLALDAVKASLEQRQPFDLVCLDIMLPGLDGQQILKSIRELEERHGYPVGRGAKVVMTTALRDKSNILTAFRAACDGYLTKPIDKAKLQEQLRGLFLIQ